MIQYSTGKGKKNRSADVVALQLLLNEVDIAKIKPAENVPDANVEYILSKGSSQTNIEQLPALKVDGLSIAPLVARIEIYQKAKKMKLVDGWISKRGGTLKALLKDAGVTTSKTRMSYIRNKIPRPNGVNVISVDKALSLYQKQYASLSADDKEGLRYILSTAKCDTEVTFIPELAYMLATTKHETAHTFRGIEEYGKGASRPYGKEITVTDPKTKKAYKNKYYGRGYVQLTWGYNYQRIDHKLGNGTFPNRNKVKVADYNKGFTITDPSKSIYLNPQKALKKEVAYTGLIWGMHKGIYTGRKISNYVTTGKIDYINARRVINGTDKASKIANYAEDIEILLRTSTL